MTGAAVSRTLRTPRLTLRPLRTDDRQALVEGVGNYDVARWLSVVPYPYALADADDFLARSAEGLRPVWGICDPSGLVGTIGAGDELGYWLARSAWGKGYATEAGEAVLDWVFGVCKKRRLSASHFVGNDRSRHVLGKLGFRPTGSRRVDALALSQEVEATTLEMTRRDWQLMRQFRVRTQRLDIREVREVDWRQLQRLGGVPEVAPMLLSVPLPWSEADVRRWIARAPYRGRPGFRATIRLRRGRVIGSLGIGRNPGGDRFSCYYWLGRDHWGKGYATEAMTAFLTECYARFPALDAVHADHFADNPASGRVLGKLGFVPVGEGMATSAARLEPAPDVHYRVSRATFGAQP